MHPGAFSFLSKWHETIIYQTRSIPLNAELVLLIYMHQYFSCNVGLITLGCSVVHLDLIQRPCSVWSNVRQSLANTTNFPRLSAITQKANSVFLGPLRHFLWGGCFHTSKLYKPWLMICLLMHSTCRCQTYPFTPFFLEMRRAAWAFLCCSNNNKAE